MPWKTSRIASLTLVAAALMPWHLGAQENAAPASPEDGGPRNWIVSRALNLRESPSTTAPVVDRLTPQTLLDNLGCEYAEGRAWCFVQPLGGGPVGFVAAEFIEPAVSPDGSVATGPDDSALRAGQKDFDARGSIPCAQERGQPMGTCEFAVARAGGGYATVVVEVPGERERVLYFRMGIAIGVESSEADPTGEFRAQREGDLTLIRVGDERYEVPDALVLGG